MLGDVYGYAAHRLGVAPLLVGGQRLAPVAQGLLPAAQAAQGHPPLEQQVGLGFPVIRRLQGESALVVAQGVLERRRTHGLLTSQGQVADRLPGVGGGARLVEVVSQVSGVLLQSAGIRNLYRLGHP